MLVDGERDALICPTPPKDFYAPNSLIVRLFSDFRKAEQTYALRTGISPLQHIVGIRRHVFERDPWLVKNLYQALEHSKQVWQASRRRLADALPWTLADIEESTALMGEDWYRNGVGPNRKNIQAFLEEQIAQGLIITRLFVDDIFPEFLQALNV